jgi:hypothetical protein
VPPSTATRAVACVLRLTSALSMRCTCITVALALDLTSPAERQQLRQDALATPEVQRWLDNLGRSRPIHRSQDTKTENPSAKLFEYGLDRQVPASDETAQLPLPSLPIEEVRCYSCGGSHMGEDRRSKQAMERESTFRMLSVQRRTQCRT